MKVSKEKAAENREMILDAAARLFREKGLSEVGVGTLSEAAGLTHGSVYSQFGSKEKLMTEAMKYAFGKNAARATEMPSLVETLDYYLSAAHRDRLGRGCMIAALGCEMPRQSRSVRKTFTDGLQRNLARISAKLSKREKRSREDDAIALFAAMVGTLVLARAVDDSQFSDRILAASHKRLLKDFKAQAA
jgi:TetR/AcrR family transcriptional regulator, transcriptional repressor for nem operon